MFSGSLSSMGPILPSLTLGRTPWIVELKPDGAWLNQRQLTDGFVIKSFVMFANERAAEFELIRLFQECDAAR
jgi:hypothetical protein